MLAKQLFPYEKNKEKFLKNSNRSRGGFKEALVEIVKNPKVKWGMRGQEDEDEDEDDDDDEDESAVNSVRDLLHLLTVKTFLVHSVAEFLCERKSSIF